MSQASTDRPQERALDIDIIAIGSFRTGPERELLDDYMSRLKRLGPQLGLRHANEIECASGGGRDGEAGRLVGKCRPGAHVVILDERGKAYGSQQLAHQIGRLRDDGCNAMCFLIGGAAGHGEPARTAAHEAMALGVQTWPHRLVRVMLAEQLYRAATILAGQPYHKA